MHIVHIETHSRIENKRDMRYKISAERGRRRLGGKIKFFNHHQAQTKTKVSALFETERAFLCIFILFVNILSMSHIC